MVFKKKHSRRNILKTGFATAAAAVVTAHGSQAEIRQKQPGETKIVAALGYDSMHNGIGYEIHIRSIFRSKKDWHIIFCRRGETFTPGLISDADLVMIQLFGGQDHDAISGTFKSSSKPAWTDENVEAIIDNVRNRGMGLMAVHNAIWIGNAKLKDLIGTRAILHHEIQPVIFKDFNQDHPITQGMEEFFINLDEQFNVEIINPSTTTILFRILAVHDKNDCFGGWCLKQGKGRVVGLLPGHEHWCYREKRYQEIFWRAAHWAMGREIEPFNK